MSITMARIVCEGNIMHRVVDYKLGDEGYVDCLGVSQSQPVAPEHATPHESQRVARAELFGINIIRFYGKVSEEPCPTP
jgi:hypothetical protein